MQARKNQQLTVATPDLAYWKSQIKCQAACPVHTDARGYVRAIAEGDYRKAYLIARGPNPLASICGRVCGAPCEQACRRGDIDKPVAIRALKRFVCDRFGPEVREEGGAGLVEFLRTAAAEAAPRQCQDSEELLPLLRARTVGSVEPIKGRSVGIIGSGPAGLAAAHDLALLGARVTIYEMEAVLAGMLAVGIPEYRLPRDLVRAEVEVVTALGVQAVTNCQVGKDVSLPELRQRHDAVIIAVGAKRSRLLPIPGAEAKGVVGGVEFLRDVALGNDPALGRRVVVIGGGNVAYDVGRSVVRQISVDAARVAVRERSDATVHLCSLESLEEMPADDVEIIEGDEEGVLRRNSLGPVQILTDTDGAVRGVEFRRCLSVFDADRRFAPQFDDEDREIIECETVLVAVGQGFDLSFLDADRDGLEMNERGAVVCDPESGVTSAADIFVAGDLAYGPKLLIHAVASGKSVARAIYKKFTGTAIDFRATELHLAVPDYARELGYERRRREDAVAAPADQRIRDVAAPVELGLDEEAATREAGRCLDCGVNTIFDGSKCILCGGCVDVCPSLCLRIVGADSLVGSPVDSPVDSSTGDDQRQACGQIVQRQLAGVPPEEASAIIKDETECIRCALCAERCPTGAITMERFIFEEVPQCRAA